MCFRQVHPSTCKASPMPVRIDNGKRDKRLSHFHYPTIQRLTAPHFHGRIGNPHAYQDYLSQFHRFFCSDTQVTCCAQHIVNETRPRQQSFAHNPTSRNALQVLKKPNMAPREQVSQSHGNIDISQVPGTVHLVDLEEAIATRHAKGHHDIILVPTPSSDPDDPLNWSPGRKRLALLCIML